jgi:hypothetical protein
VSLCGFNLLGRDKNAVDIDFTMLASASSLPYPLKDPTPLVLSHMLSESPLPQLSLVLRFAECLLVDTTQ